MRYLILTIAVHLLITSTSAWSQGCSDAGICTFGEFDDAGIEQGSRIITEVSYIFGLGENQNLVNTLQVDQRFGLFENKGGIFFRIPFTYVYGVMAQTTGLGDVTAGLDYSVYQSDQILVSIMAGAKLPSDNANKSSDGKGLPMAYQTSLGTYDLLAAAAVDIKRWRLGLAYQKSFGSNENTFLHDTWEGDRDALQYFESNKLKRGDDVMLRLDKDFVLKNENRLQAGLLAVYHIEKDQIDKDNETISIENSDGLTFNVNIGYDILLKNHDALRLLLAVPLISREYIADGLTRTIVFSFTYLIGS